MSVSCIKVTSECYVSSKNEPHTVSKICFGDLKLKMIFNRILRKTY